MADPLNSAVDVFLRLEEALSKIPSKDKEKVEKELKPGIRALSREAPGLFLDIGFAPAVTFYLSKAGVNVLAKAVRLVEHGDVEGLGGKVDWGKLANALYLYVVLKYLERVAGKIACDGREFELNLFGALGDPKVFEKSLYGYVDCLSRPTVGAAAVRLLQEYLVHFKRLCEASFPSRGEG